MTIISDTNWATLQDSTPHACRDGFNHAFARDQADQALRALGPLLADFKSRAARVKRAAGGAEQDHDAVHAADHVAQTQWLHEQATRYRSAGSRLSRHISLHTERGNIAQVLAGLPGGACPFAVTKEVIGRALPGHGQLQQIFDGCGTTLAGLDVQFALAPTGIDVSGPEEGKHYLAVPRRSSRETDTLVSLGAWSVQREPEPADALWYLTLAELRRAQDVGPAIESGGIAQALWVLIAAVLMAAAGGAEAGAGYLMGECARGDKGACAGAAILGAISAGLGAAAGYSYAQGSPKDSRVKAPAQARRALSSILA